MGCTGQFDSHPAMSKKRAEVIKKDMIVAWNVSENNLEVVSSGEVPFVREVVIK